jgi:hypothetical protein
MDFTRDILPHNPLRLDAATLCSRLAPGCWVIEGGCRPPAAHDPHRLPGGYDLVGGLAVSLSSATLSGLSLGPALVDRLAALGASVAPLAGLALHELIINAVLHGNLQVASGGSGDWEDLEKRQAAFGRALADPWRAGRTVTIVACWGIRGVVVTITDEGKGYDAAAPQKVSSGSGRGLRLARMVGRVGVTHGGRQTAITMDNISYPKEIAA